MPQNCAGTNCPVLITYKSTRGMPGYVDIEMQTNQQYIALGHNTAPRMVSVISFPKQPLRGLLMNGFSERFRKPPFSRDWLTLFELFLTEPP